MSAIVILCWLATAGSWVWALARPVYRGGNFDFSGIQRMQYCAVALIATLIVWLAYFAGLHFWGAGA
jgi:hypothetical protein